jgi:hypothetical protein
MLLKTSWTSVWRTRIHIYSDNCGQTSSDLSTSSVGVGSLSQLLIVIQFPMRGRLHALRLTGSNWNTHICDYLSVQGLIFWYISLFMSCQISSECGSNTRIPVNCHAGIAYSSAVSVIAMTKPLRTETDLGVSQRSIFRGIEFVVWLYIVLTVTIGRVGAGITKESLIRCVNIF